MKMWSIKQLREKKHWTQQELADAVEVSVATVFKWEKGAVEPRASKLRRMSEEFGVTMNEIAFPVVDSQQGKTRKKTVAQDDPGDGDKALTSSQEARR